MTDKKITTGRMVAILILSGFGVAALITRQCVGVMMVIGLIVGPVSYTHLTLPTN